MTHLYEKMQETEAGRWASVIHQILYDHGHKFGDDAENSKVKKKMLDLAHYLERIAFVELDKQAEDEHAWIGELREKISLDKELKKG